MNKINSTVLAASLTLLLSGTAFASTMPPPADPAPVPAAPAEVTFEQLDTDADGYVAKTDIPVEHELSLQFTVADSNQDSRLSRDEFNAFQDQPEEEEAEE